MGEVLAVDVLEGSVVQRRQKQRETADVRTDRGLCQQEREDVEKGLGSYNKKRRAV
jgi:hypothetical protein